MAETHIKDLDITDYRFGESIVRYLTDKKTGQTALQLIPANKINDLATRPELLDLPELKRMNFEQPTWEVGSLVHLHLREDPQPASTGMTLRDGASVKRLRIDSQELIEGGDTKTVRTVLKTLEEENQPLKYECLHEVIYREGDQAFEIRTRFKNTSSQELTLEMLSSFSLDNLSPFQSGDGIGKINCYRQRGGWSLEGAIEKQSLEALGLERSWCGYFKESERYGQVGSFPVKRYFPFAAMEDSEAGVTWGARLAWAGSWQMEMSRVHDCVSLNGGLADFELGHWAKTIAPGESFDAPPAHIAVVDGDLEKLTHNLNQLQHHPANSQPAIEQDLPIVFNEWCTSWGHPDHENLLALADRLQDSGVKYLVIDAGWTEQVSEGISNQGGNGDWRVCPKAFPNGIDKTTAAIRERGLIPGVWFEFEVTTAGAHVYSPSFDDWHLKRHGEVIKTDGWRSFWDFRQARVIDYLTEKVIDFLRENDFGFMKVDYNGNIGFGCDGAESLGEGLRAHIEGMQNFFAKIRKELPELVIENCASGGHRIEPSMMGLTAMTSVTDAHECVEIPRIAANLRHALLPRQASIWATLHSTDSMQRLSYSLAATFLGRMCLSGPVHELDADQWQFTKDAMALYQRSAQVIKHGYSSFHGEVGRSVHNPTGTQAVLRLSDDQKSALLVYHSFDTPQKSTIELQLPSGQWEISGSVKTSEHAQVQNNQIKITELSPWEGGVLLLELN